MTYEEIKDAARCVEQREDPSMSNDPIHEEECNLQCHGMTDNGIGSRQPHSQSGSAPVWGSDKAL